MLMYTLRPYARKIFNSILVLLPALCITVPIFSQPLKMNYQVKKGNKEIGVFTVEENITQDTKIIRLESHIKTSFGITVAVDAKEEAVFQNGVLHHSTVYREVNGNEKINKKHRLYNNGYIIESGKKTDTVCCTRIIYNLMGLYSTEPVGIRKVYSDNHQKFLAIKKTDEHVYRIDMPDGNYNIYFYKNGKCIKVEMHQSFYTVMMVLI